MNLRSVFVIVLLGILACVSVPVRSFPTNISMARQAHEIDPVILGINEATWTKVCRMSTIFLVVHCTPQLTVLGGKDITAQDRINALRSGTQHIVTGQVGHYPTRFLNKNGADTIFKFLSDECNDKNAFLWEYPVVFGNKAYTGGSPGTFRAIFRVQSNGVDIWQTRYCGTIYHNDDAERK